MNALYIVTTYVLLDDTFKQLAFVDDARTQVSSAEILTVAVVAARYFQNHQERALCILQQQCYLPALSVSRFNRRLHRLLGNLRHTLRHVQSLLPAAALYMVDAFPLPVCKRVRQRHCQKVRGERFVGRCEAKREWFFGYKLHWCCDATGAPVAFTLRPARRHERAALTPLLSHLPVGATVLGDGAYVSAARAAFWQQRGVRLIAKRYGRMSPNTQEERRLLRQRLVIEIVHSQLESMGLQRLRARTRAGFCLKVAVSLLAILLIQFVPV
jgi:IS5 family transposase